MYYTKGYGLSVDDIKMSCPADMRVYVKAHESEIGDMDMYVWSAVGTYVYSAVGTAIDNVLHGKKSHAKYMDKPILDTEQRKALVERDIQKQRELFVAKLETMKANWDMSHGK